MGTRSIVRFKEKRGETVKELTAVYQQFDGYLSGVGDELCKFLQSAVMVNGLDGKNTKVFNGMGCLAAQFIASQKQAAGGLYLHAPGCEDEECNYEVEGGYTDEFEVMPLTVRYKAYGDHFEGTVDEFRKYIDSEEERDGE